MVMRMMVVVLCAACGASARSAGGPGAPAGGGERADISSVRAALDVYTDGKGHMVALVEPDPERPVDGELRLFYGDGKTFHAVPVTTATSDGLRFEIGFRDPRIPSSPAGSIVRELGKVVLSCYGTDVELSKLPPPEAQAMVGAAGFLQNRTRHAPLALVRDGDRFLYVDTTTGADDEYRVFTGTKGKMREIAVTDAKYDDRENTWRFQTAEGTLVAMRDPAQRSYVITAGWEGKKEGWASLDRAESWRLIFEELGVYREPRTPTPCDPMMP